MATFTPPTHTEYVLPPGQDRLWSRVPYQRAEAVLIEDGVASVHTIVDSDRLIAAESVFLNALTYTITADEELALAGALDPVAPSLSNETWPAWL